jgi:hypothetical protein
MCLYEIFVQPSEMAHGQWTMALVIWQAFLLCVMPETLRSKLVSQRMDNNLFIREQQGLLKDLEKNTPAERLNERFSRAQMFAFTRFLSERLPIKDFRWERPGEEMRLRAGSPKLSLPLTLASVVFPKLRWKHCSWISLKSDGSASSHCGEQDVQKVRDEPGPVSPDIGEMERHVASAVENAWKHFRAVNVNQAERAIGQVPEEEIFITPLPRITAEHVVRAMFIGVVLFVVLTVVAVSLFGLDPFVSMGHAINKALDAVTH